MAQTYKEHLQSLLLQDERVKDEQGELKGNVVKELANKLDEKLIEALLQDDKSREKFFLKIKDVYVFKANDFKFYLEQNSLDNSFTNYANQIGLTLNGKFLKDTTDVVLDFPYKDCILEGGQSTEEGLDTFYEYDNEKEDYTEKQSKRKEIFFNTIVAKDEIDRLLEPKAFENITKYDANGESKPTQFNRNKEGIITDNLIIKGNNLLALHSLKEEFKGCVKLIYIDPPYYFNKPVADDSFNYNSNFRLSTWLTFMYNRFEVSKYLLKSDGFIFVQIKSDGYAYLKLLLDLIYGVDNFVNSIAVKMSESSGVKMAHIDKKLPNIFEHILCYKLNDNTKINPIKVKKEDENENSKLDKYLKYYSKIIVNINDEVENWNIIPIEDYHKINNLPIPEDNFKDFKIKNANRIVYRTNNKSFEKLNINKKISRVLSSTGIEYIWWEGKQMLFLEEYISEFICDLWVDISTINLNKEGGVDLPNGKKPEKLLQRIIELATKENDIVLDYHLGSGTTAAVAHKMNRQYIGLEQLDYGVNDSIKRLKNVVDGDQSGISKAVNWKGGGSIVYLELAKNNQKAIEQIQKCNSYIELVELFDTLYTKYFMHYNVKIKAFKEVISKEENFINLSLERQKEIFCRMLDNNQLYVNRDEMEDSKYGLSPEDIALTKDFYQIKE